MKLFYSFLLLFAILAIFSAVSSVLSIKQGQQYNGYKPAAPNQVQHSGRMTIDNITGKALFYWIIESSNKAGLKDIPIVLFLSGGPSCSSSMSLFDETGPYLVNRQTGVLTANPYSWTGFAHMLYVDMPCGVGFSTCGSSPAEHHDFQVAEDMFNFFQEFYEYYPQYRDNRLFISGESFGGQWVPTTAYVIFKAQLEKRGKYPIHFHGFEIGNGLTDPTFQYPQYPKLAYEWCKVVTGTPCVNETTYRQMEASVPKCLEMIRICNESGAHGEQCDNATDFCNANLMDPYVENGYNFYDIRLKTQYNFDYLTKFMNQEELQKSAWGGYTVWQMCNMTSHGHFNDGWEIDRAQLVSEMLQTELNFKGNRYYPRVLLIGGTDDFAVNAFGVKSWALNMKWPLQAEFGGAHDFPFYIKDLPAGTIRSISTMGGPMGFSFAGIFNAGHMAPHDAPESCYEVLLHFVENEKFFEYDLPQYPKNF